MGQSVGDSDSQGWVSAVGRGLHPESQEGRRDHGPLTPVIVGTGGIIGNTLTKA